MILSGLWKMTQHLLHVIRRECPFYSEKNKFHLDLDECVLTMLAIDSEATDKHMLAFLTY